MRAACWLALAWSATVVLGTDDDDGAFGADAQAVGGGHDAGCPAGKFTATDFAGKPQIKDGMYVCLAWIVMAMPMPMYRCTHCMHM